MIYYAIKKFYDYFFKKIDKKIEKEALELLSEKEKEIYNNMQYYDKIHGLSVYKELSKKIKDIEYLKMAILHDCGKEYASFLLRVFHKLGIKTRLNNHAQKGYEKLKNINLEVANLIKIHHNKNVNDKMKLFQSIDDRS